MDCTKTGHKRPRNWVGTRTRRKMGLEQRQAGRVHRQGEQSKDMSGNDSTEHSAAFCKAAYTPITWGG